jgi:tetratricopeptide (TPR) repeat protein
MIDKSRWIKIIIGSLLIGILLGGVISFSHRLFPASPEKLLEIGEETYAKGEAALKAGDGHTAAARFEEANLQANKALDAMAREKSKDSSVDWSRIEGLGLWLKTRALRDEAFALAMEKGEPYPETPDPVSGKSFRSILYIPDPQLSLNVRAFLDKASELVKDDRELLRQALLTETILPVHNWGKIEKIARAMLQLDPNDPWALYLLARIDYDQPLAYGRAEHRTPEDKRSRERVLQARRYIERLKSLDNYPLWRTLFLEAEIANWLRDAAEQSNASRSEAEDETLRGLLFGPKGALVRAASGEGLDHPSKWDAEGVIGLHQLALHLAVRDSLQPEGKTEKVVELLDSTLELCRKLADRVPTLVSECTLSAIRALTDAEPVLATNPPPNWSKQLQSVQELAAKAREQKIALPQLYESLAKLLNREANIEGRRGQKKRQDELDQQSVQWIDDGLRIAAEAKIPPTQLVGLNALAADIKTIKGDKKDDISRYLSALKEAKSPRALALVAFFEAVPAAREGRLNEARRLLEKIVASRETDLVLQANMILGGVYLDLGEPDKALGSLQQVQSAYTVLDKLTPQQRAWALEFVRSPEDLTLLLIKGNTDSALAKLREQARRNPGKPISLDSIRYQEKAIAELRKSLPKETPQDRQAREILISYDMATGRRADAEKELTELKSYYPNNLDVLRTEVSWIESARDANGKPMEASVKDAEQRIEKYIKDHPSDLNCRYYRVEWLIAHGRVDDALTYLRSPANFFDPKSELYQRVLAAALLAKGDRQESQKILEHLPHDPTTDAMLIQAASSADKQQAVNEALARHDDNALFQSMQAIQVFNKGEYQSAAELFLKASRYYRFEASSKRGMLLALLAQARKDPAAARSYIERLHKEWPDEPLLLVASAFADVLLDEIGNVNDNPDPIKSMSSALNAWEQMVLEQSPQNRVSAPLTKSAFWALASRHDLALNEAVRALSLEPSNPVVLRQAIVLALELNDPDLRAVTTQRLDTLLRLRQNNADDLFLEARFDENNDRIKEAIAIYQDLLKKNPKLTAVYARLIPLLAKQGEKEAASSYVQLWRKELPESIDAAKMQVRLLAQNKDIKGARRFAEQIIDENLERERKSLSAASSRTSDPQKIQKILDDRRLTLQLLMIDGLREAKAWSEAENWLTQLQAKYPDHPMLLISLGDVYVAQSQWKQARDIYEKVWSKDQSQALVGNNLAWLLAKYLNEAPKAMSIISVLRLGKFSRKPITGDRLRLEFLDTLGLIYTKAAGAAQYGEMRDLFEQARERYPNDPRLCLYLGRAYAGLGEEDRAQHLYEAALELAAKPDRALLSPKQCEEVIAEAKSAQKELKHTDKP